MLITLQLDDDPDDLISAIAKTLEDVPGPLPWDQRVVLGCWNVSNICLSVYNKAKLIIFLGNVPSDCPSYLAVLCACPHQRLPPLLTPLSPSPQPGLQHAAEVSHRAFWSVLSPRDPESRQAIVRVDGQRGTLDGVVHPQEPRAISTSSGLEGRGRGGE